MPVIKRGDRAFTDALAAGFVLTVTAEVGSMAKVALQASIGGDPYAEVVPAGASRTFGPFITEQAFRVDALVGNVAAEKSPMATGDSFALLRTDPATGIQSLVSGDGTLYPLGPTVSTWANRAALVTAGVTSAFFTDVGIGGSVWQYGAGRWRPLTGRVVIKNAIVDVTNSAAPEVVLDYATLLPGLWQDGDLLEIGFRKSRTGGTSDTDASLIKLGTVAATPGTVTGLGSAAALATTTIELTMKSLRLRRLTNTSFRPLNIPGSVGVGGGTAAIADVTGFANLDNATAYLQICSDLTTAGGEVSVLRSYTVELIAGA